MRCYTTVSPTVAQTTAQTGTYHLVQPEDLLALGCQINLGDSNFPSPVTPTALGAHSPANNLMSKAHAYDTHAIRRNSLLRILNKLKNPRIVIERRVARASDQNRIDVVERRVAVQIVHNIVALDGDEIGKLLGLCGCFEECSENARVAAVAIAGLGLGRVGFEDGEAKRRHFGWSFGG